MTENANYILNIYKTKGLREGEGLSPNNFLNFITAEKRNSDLIEGLKECVKLGLLIDTEKGVNLTKEGYAFIKR